MNALAWRWSAGRGQLAPSASQAEAASSEEAAGGAAAGPGELQSSGEHGVQSCQHMSPPLGKSRSCIRRLGSRSGIVMLTQ